VQVGEGGLITYPVQTLAPARVKEVAGAASVMVGVASSTPYATWFAFSGMIDTYPSLRAASFYNPAGNVVAPGPDTILSMVNDFANTSDYVLALGTPWLLGMNSRSS
jgi:hypothetical protein